MTVVVVGAGQAGVQAAISARDAGYSKRVVLVGAESVSPYQRPPLSKSFLAGDCDASLLALRPAPYFTAAGIELLRGVAVTHIERVGSYVELADGRCIEYERLVLATGSKPRALDVGNTPRGVLSLRTISDAAELSDRVANGSHVVIVGAGYLGLEIASTLRGAGAHISVLEAATRVLNRTASPAMSEAIAQLHLADGVDLVMGESVAGWGTDTAGNVRVVHTSAGRILPADVVVVAIGVTPETSLAEQAGLPTHDGITVGPDLITSDPAIAAIGDCARFISPWSANPVRIESVPSACDQARTVGAWLADGQRRAHTDIPWFWSEQAGHQLHTAGLIGEGSDTVTRNGPGPSQRTIFHLRDGILQAAESLDSPAVHLAVRSILSDQRLRERPIGAAALSDPTFNLREYCRNRLIGSTR
jgi:3-phenylpropionate/trans-cinnamate dioxygenase ferredoxin reductase subunit